MILVENGSQEAGECPTRMRAKRGRALEDEYFWKKDREMIEKFRQAAAAEEARKDLGRKAGLDDPELLQELQDLGFTPETVGLLPLVPIVQWRGPKAASRRRNAS